MPHPDPDPAPPPFLERVRLALNMSRMELAHALSMSVGELRELSELPRSELSASDPMWLHVETLLSARTGASSAMLSEVRLFLSRAR